MPKFKRVFVTHLLATFQVSFYASFALMHLEQHWIFAFSKQIKHVPLQGLCLCYSLYLEFSCLFICMTFFFIWFMTLSKIISLERISLILSFSPPISSMFLFNTPEYDSIFHVCAFIICFPRKYLRFIKEKTVLPLLHLHFIE